MAESSGNGSWELPGNITERFYARFPLIDKSPEKLTKQERAEAAKDERTSTLEQRQEWSDLVEALRLHRRQLLRIPGVTAVDIGYRIKGNVFQDELALRAHVEHKLPPECFKDRQHELIPSEYPSRRGTVVKVDVIEAKYQPSASFQPPRRGTVLETPRRVGEVNRRQRIDPLVGGISIGSPQTPVGTLGALVWDKTDGSVCILSNWHVLAGGLNVEAGNPCFQPGRFDQGRSSDVVAHLKRWSFDSQTDAAIAELTGNRHYCAGEILSLYQQVTGVTKPHLGMEVLKSGRSIEFSTGFVDGLFFSTVIEYSGGIVQVFEDQIHIAPLLPKDNLAPIQPISEPGDSGSVWVTKSNGDGYRAVGLHFAGDLPNSAFGEYALANPMTLVAKRLKFSFRPLFLEIRDEDVVSPPPPAVSQPIQVHLGNGMQPLSMMLGKLIGTGGEPDPIQVGGGGGTG